MRPYGRRDSVLLVLCIVAALVAQFLPDRMRDPMAAVIRRSLLSPLVDLQHDAELTHRAWLTREAQIVSRDSVVLRAMALDAVTTENAHLRRVLGLGARLKWGFVPAEVLPGRGVGEDYTVVLSAGSNAGVRPFSPVVAPEGLVGMVKTADPTMSIAITWEHPDFRVSAMAADGTAYGIVAPHAGSEPEHDLLEMRGVPVRSTLRPGTLIVSSGLGSTFPRGIPVGTVLGEVRTSEVWARTYLLRPAVMPPEMSTVMVLTPRRVTAGVNGVWQTGRGMDAAVRAIVAAGDSLARATRMDSLVRAQATEAAIPDTARIRRDALRARREAGVRPDSVRGRVRSLRRDSAVVRRSTAAAPHVAPPPARPPAATPTPKQTAKPTVMPTLTPTVTPTSPPRPAPPRDSVQAPRLDSVPKPAAAPPPGRAVPHDSTAPARPDTASHAPAPDSTGGA